MFYRRRLPVQGAKDEKEKKEEDVKEEEQTEESREDTPPTKDAPPTSLPIRRQALSPAVAECQRAIFAAFLWQEGLVHDAMASALYLKFHPDVLKEFTPPSSKPDSPVQDMPLEEERVADEKKITPDEKIKLPSTLHHLVAFWDEISQKVIDSSSASFSPPKVPPFAQELMKRYEEEKKEMEKLKKEKEKKSGVSAAAGGGSTTCELCDNVFPDPVTYHMKETHAGCGKHANGWGYNSRGSYCSGWAGNCGDGGRGGSTWYLMCKDCHGKYLSQKEESKRKVVKPVSVPKMKTRKPGKSRSLPVVSSVLGMIQNAKFLLEISSSNEGPKVKSPSVNSLGPDLSRHISTPDDSAHRTKEAPSLGRPKHPPVLARSVSVVTGGSEQHMKRTFSDSGEDLNAPPIISRQYTHIPESNISSKHTSSLMTRPSMALANLMYLRSCHSQDSGYDRLMTFVTCYHDLMGLKVTMKQMMRIASLRATALEVRREI